VCALVDTQPTLVTELRNHDNMLLMGDVYNFAHNSYILKQCKMWTIFEISIGLGFIYLLGEGGRRGGGGGGGGGVMFFPSD